MSNPYSGFKPDAPAAPSKADARPDVDVYNPSSGNLVKVPFDMATEMAEGGAKVGTDAQNEQLNQGLLAKTGAFATGVANFAGVHNAILGTASKLGVDAATRELRREQQVNDLHPYYHTAGELLPAVIPFAGLEGLAAKGLGGVGGAAARVGGAASEGIAGLYEAGGIGAKATAKLGSYGKLGEIAAGLGNGALAGVPAMVAKGQADTLAASEAGHKEYDEQLRRDVIVKDPFTVELMAATAYHDLADTVLLNTGVHVGFAGLRQAARASKGVLGAMEKYGLMKRAYHAAPPEQGGAPRASAYVRVDTTKTPTGSDALKAEQKAAAAAAGETTPEVQIPGLPENAGPDSYPATNRSNGLYEADNARDAGIPDEMEIAEAKRRGNERPRPAHIEAMVREHGVIGLPGDMPAVEEHAVGIPRKEIHIPEPEAPPVHEPKYAGDPKLQRLHEEAQASHAQAKRMAAERIEAEAIPKRDVGIPPPEPIAPEPEINAADIEPEFTYGADYKKVHKLEALRQMMTERLTKAHPEAMAKWNENKAMTDVYEHYKTHQTELGWAEKQEAARARKVVLKDELRAMAPRIYDPVTKTYAPGFHDINEEMKRVYRGDLAYKPTVTYGPKNDKAAEAAHLEALKEHAKESAAFQKAATKAEAEHVRLQAAAEKAAARENAANKAAEETAAKRLQKIEERIAERDKAIARKEADAQAAAERKHADALKRFDERVAKAQAKAKAEEARAQVAQRNAKAKQDWQAQKAAAKRRADEHKAVQDAIAHERRIAELEAKQARDFAKENAKAEKAAAAEKATKERLEAKRAREADRAAIKADKEAKAKAAKDSKAEAKEARERQKAIDAAKPKWEEKQVEEVDDDLGRKTTTTHVKHENGGTTTKTTIKIKAPKVKPEMIAGDLEEPFSQGFIWGAGGTAAAAFGPHVGAGVVGGMNATNKFVKYALNSKKLHDAFAEATRHLQFNIAPLLKRLVLQNRQRGRREKPSATMSLASYEPATKAVGYASQNPTALQDALDQQAPNLAKVHPELITGIKITASKAFQQLNDSMPKTPYDAPLQDRGYNPPRSAQIAFLHKFEVMGNPVAALESGDPTAIRMVSEVYPNLYREYCSQITAFVREHKTPMYDRQARLISQFIGANVRPIDDPKALQRLQQTGGPEQPDPNQQKPIGKSNAPTKAASQRANLDAPDAMLNAIGS